MIDGSGERGEVHRNLAALLLAAAQPKVRGSGILEAFEAWVPQGAATAMSQHVLEPIPEVHSIWPNFVVNLEPCEVM